MKRWLPRTFFIALLLLCVAGWVKSNYIRYGVRTVRTATSTAHCLDVSLWRGRLCVFYDHYDCDALEKNHFNFYTQIVGAPPWGSVKFSFLKWGVGWESGMTDYFVAPDFMNPHERFSRRLYIEIPMWFISGMATLLLWFAWRKTRPKLKSGTFPVTAYVTTDHQTIDK